MRRTAWTLVALYSLLGLSLVGKVAYAQTYDDQKQGQTGDQAPGGVDQAQPPSQPGQAQPPREPAEQPMQAPSDMGTQPDVGTPPEATPTPSEQQGQQQGAQGEQGKSSARLSQLSADGVKLSALDENQIMELQRSLQTAGYYTAEVDGKAGPKTKQALSRFYGDQAHLAARGLILPQGAGAVGLDQAEVERVRGVEPQNEQNQKEPQKGIEPQQQPQNQPQQPMNREGDSTHAPPSTGAPMQQKPGDTMEHPSEGHDQPDTSPMP